MEKRRQQGSNLRGRSPTDFKSVSLTTRTYRHCDNSYDHLQNVMLGGEESMSDEAIWKTLPEGTLQVGSKHQIPSTRFLIFHGQVALPTRISFRSRQSIITLMPLYSLSYNTFSGYLPEVVKKMAKKDLTEQIWRLQAALGELSEIAKYSQQEYEMLQNEKVLCRICFEGEICMVLLPCPHRTICKNCSEKCKKCLICRATIEERMPVL